MGQTLIPNITIEALDAAIVQYVSMFKDNPDEFVAFHRQLYATLAPSHELDVFITKLAGEVFNIQAKDRDLHFIGAIYAAIFIGHEAHKQATNVEMLEYSLFQEPAAIVKD